MSATVPAASVARFEDTCLTLPPSGPSLKAAANLASIEEWLPLRAEAFERLQCAQSRVTIATAALTCGLEGGGFDESPDLTHHGHQTQNNSFPEVSAETAHPSTDDDEPSVIDGRPGTAGAAARAFWEQGSSAPSASALAPNAGPRGRPSLDAGVGATVAGPGVLETPDVSGIIVDHSAPSSPMQGLGDSVATPAGAKPTAGAGAHRQTPFRAGLVSSDSASTFKDALGPHAGDDPFIDNIVTVVTSSGIADVVRDRGPSFSRPTSGSHARTKEPVSAPSLPTSRPPSGKVRTSQPPRPTSASLISPQQDPNVESIVRPRSAKSVASVTTASAPEEAPGGDGGADNSSGESPKAGARTRASSAGSRGRKSRPGSSDPGAGRKPTKRAASSVVMTRSELRSATSGTVVSVTSTGPGPVAPRRVPVDLTNFDFAAAHKELRLLHEEAQAAYDEFASLDAMITKAQQGLALAYPLISTVDGFATTDEFHDDDAGAAPVGGSREAPPRAPPQLDKTASAPSPLNMSSPDGQLFGDRTNDPNATSSSAQPFSGSPGEATSGVASSLPQRGFKTHGDFALLGPAPMATLRMKQERKVAPSIASLASSKSIAAGIQKQTVIPLPPSTMAAAAMSASASMSQGASLMSHPRGGAASGATAPDVTGSARQTPTLKPFEPSSRRASVSAGAGGATTGFASTTGSLADDDANGSITSAPRTPRTLARSGSKKPRDMARPGSPTFLRNDDDDGDGTPRGDSPLSRRGSKASRSASMADVMSPHRTMSEGTIGPAPSGDHRSSASVVSPSRRSSRRTSSLNSPIAGATGTNFDSSTGGALDDHDRPAPTLTPRLSRMVTPRRKSTVSPVALAAAVGARFSRQFHVDEQGPVDRGAPPSDGIRPDEAAAAAAAGYVVGGVPGSTSPHDDKAPMTMSTSARGRTGSNMSTTFTGVHAALASSGVLIPNVSAAITAAAASGAKVSNATSPGRGFVHEASNFPVAEAIRRAIKDPTVLLHHPKAASVALRILIFQASVRRHVTRRRYKATRRFFNRVRTTTLRAHLVAWWRLAAAVSHRKRYLKSKSFTAFQGFSNIRRHRRALFRASIERVRLLSTAARCLESLRRVTAYHSADVVNFKTGERDVSFPPNSLHGWETFLKTDQAEWVEQQRPGVAKLTSSKPRFALAAALSMWRTFVTTEKRLRYGWHMACAHHERTSVEAHFSAWRHRTQYSVQILERIKTDKLYYLRRWRRSVKQQLALKTSLDSFEKAKKLTLLVRWRRKALAHRQKQALALAVLQQAGAFPRYAVANLRSGCPTVAPVSSATLALEKKQEHDRVQQSRMRSRELLRSGAVDNRTLPLAPADGTSGSRGASVGRRLSNGAGVGRARSPGLEERSTGPFRLGVAGVGRTLQQRLEDEEADEEKAAKLKAEMDVLEKKATTRSVFIGCWLRWRGYCKRRTQWKYFAVLQMNQRRIHLLRVCLTAWVAVYNAAKANSASPGGGRNAYLSDGRGQASSFRKLKMKTKVEFDLWAAGDMNEAVFAAKRLSSLGSAAREVDQLTKMIADRGGEGHLPPTNLMIREVPPIEDHNKPGPVRRRFNGEMRAVEPQRTHLARAATDRRRSIIDLQALQASGMALASPRGTTLGETTFLSPRGPRSPAVSALPWSPASPSLGLASPTEAAFLTGGGMAGSAMSPMSQNLDPAAAARMAEAQRINFGQPSKNLWFPMRRVVLHALVAHVKLIRRRFQGQLTFFRNQSKRPDDEELAMRRSMLTQQVITAGQPVYLPERKELNIGLLEQHVRDVSNVFFVMNQKSEARLTRVETKMRAQAATAALSGGVVAVGASGSFLYSPYQALMDRYKRLAAPPPPPKQKKRFGLGDTAKKKPESTPESTSGRVQYKIPLPKIAPGRKGRYLINLHLTTLIGDHGADIIRNRQHYSLRIARARLFAFMLTLRTAPNMDAAAKRTAAAAAVTTRDARELSREFLARKYKRVIAKFDPVNETLGLNFMTIIGFNAKFLHPDVRSKLESRRGMRGVIRSVGEVWSDIAQDLLNARPLQDEKSCPSRLRRTTSDLINYRRAITRCKRSVTWQAKRLRRCNSAGLITYATPAPKPQPFEADIEEPEVPLKTIDSEGEESAESEEEPSVLASLERTHQNMDPEFMLEKPVMPNLDDVLSDEDIWGDDDGMSSDLHKSFGRSSAAAASVSQRGSVTSQSRRESLRSPHTVDGSDRGSPFRSPGQSPRDGSGLPESERHDPTASDPHNSTARSGGAQSGGGVSGGGVSSPFGRSPRRWSHATEVEPQDGSEAGLVSPGAKSRQSSMFNASVGSVRSPRSTRQSVVSIHEGDGDSRRSPSRSHSRSGAGSPRRPRVPSNARVDDDETASFTHPGTRQNSVVSPRSGGRGSVSSATGGGTTDRSGAHEGGDGTGSGDGGGGGTGSYRRGSQLGELFPEDLRPEDDDELRGSGDDALSSHTSWSPGVSPGRNVGDIDDAHPHRQGGRRASERVQALGRAGRGGDDDGGGVGEGGAKRGGFLAGKRLSIQLAQREALHQLGGGAYVGGDHTPTPDMQSPIDKMLSWQDVGGGSGGPNDTTVNAIDRLLELAAKQGSMLSLRSSEHLDVIKAMLAKFTATAALGTAPLALAEKLEGLARGEMSSPKDQQSIVEMMKAFKQSYVKEARKRQRMAAAAAAGGAQPQTTGGGRKKLYQEAPVLFPYKGVNNRLDAVARALAQDGARMRGYAGAVKVEKRSGPLDKADDVMFTPTGEDDASYSMIHDQMSQLSMNGRVPEPDRVSALFASNGSAAQIPDMVESQSFSLPDGDRSYDPATTSMMMGDTHHSHVSPSAPRRPRGLQLNANVNASGASLALDESLLKQQTLIQANSGPPLQGWVESPRVKPLSPGGRRGQSDSSPHQSPSRGDRSGASELDVSDQRELVKHQVLRVPRAFGGGAHAVHEKLRSTASLLNAQVGGESLPGIRRTRTAAGTAGLDADVVAALASVAPRPALVMAAGEKAVGPPQPHCALDERDRQQSRDRSRSPASGRSTPQRKLRALRVPVDKEFETWTLDIHTKLSGSEEQREDALEGLELQAAVLQRQLARLTTAEAPRASASTPSSSSDPRSTPPIPPRSSGGATITQASFVGTTAGRTTTPSHGRGQGQGQGQATFGRRAITPSGSGAAAVLGRRGSSGSQPPPRRAQTPGAVAGRRAPTPDGRGRGPQAPVAVAARPKASTPTAGTRSQMPGMPVGPTEAFVYSTTESGDVSTMSGCSVYGEHIEVQNAAAAERKESDTVLGLKACIAEKLRWIEATIADSAAPTVRRADVTARRRDDMGSSPLPNSRFTKVTGRDPSSVPVPMDAVPGFPERKSPPPTRDGERKQKRGKGEAPKGSQSLDDVSPVRGWSEPRVRPTSPPPLTAGLSDRVGKLQTAGDGRATPDSEGRGDLQGDRSYTPPLLRPGSPALNDQQPASRQQSTPPAKRQGQKKAVTAKGTPKIAPPPKELEDAEAARLVTYIVMTPRSRKK